MKKAFLLLITIFTAMSMCSIHSYATENISPCYSNVAMKNSYFEIGDDGTATIRATFKSDQSVFTSATIHMKLQKRFLFFFWQDVTEWTDETTEYNYTSVHTLKVDSGTYKAIVEYTIRGTGGDPDVITDEIERTY